MPISLLPLSFGPLLAKHRGRHDPRGLLGSHLRHLQRILGDETLSGADPTSESDLGITLGRLEGRGGKGY